MKIYIVLSLFLSFITLFASEKEKGMYLFQAGFYEDALPYLQKEADSFILGVTYFRLERYQEAINELSKIESDEKYSFLKDEILYYQSISLFKLEKFSETLLVCEKISLKFPLQKEKDLLLVKILLQLQNYDKIDDIYKNYKDLEINLSSDMELGFFFSKYLVEKKEKKKAIELIKKILVKNPDSELKKSIYLFATLKLLNISLSTSQKTEICSNLTKYHQNEAANNCFAKFIDSISVKKELDSYCLAYFYNGLAYRKRRQYQSAIDSFLKVEESCPKFEENDRVFYLMATSYSAKKDYTNAIKYYTKVYKNYSKSNLADDSINYVGFIYSLQKKYKNAEKIYKEQLKLFPKGDTTEEAVWKIAYNLYKQKKYNDYIKFYNDAVQKGFEEKLYSSKKRLQYWLAKSYEALKNDKQAQKEYEDIIKTGGNNFYAFMARVKLNKSVDFNSKAAKKYSSERLIEYFKEIGVYDKIEYYSNNQLTEFLMYEITKIQKDNKEFLKTFKEELLIFLIDSKAYYLPFWNFSSQYKWQPYNMDIVEEINYFKKLYPKAYFQFIDKYAKDNNISPYLVLSIMREESYFHVSIESWANAFGLMQIIEPTAKGLAKILKVDYEKSLLFNPDYNIKLGSKYLGMNSKLFSGKLYHVIPSYNAGENAVKKWKKLYDKLPFDQFIEEIPIDETRNYVKRVLITFFIYNLIYDNHFPTLK
ncbi:transglycosylase SLT domain-containing protein [bacterium]|nr:transglycosylase SLT domain-containing protein [bacterium]